MRAFVTILILASLGLMFGCGLRGPLYLPEERSATGAEAARPEVPGDISKILSPLPAPQSQKRDRPASTTDPLPQAPAN